MPKIVNIPRSEPSDTTKLLDKIQSIHKAFNYIPPGEISLIVDQNTYDVLKQLATTFFDHVYPPDKVGCVGYLFGMAVYLSKFSPLNTIIGTTNLEIPSYREKYAIKAMV